MKKLLVFLSLTILLIGLGSCENENVKKLKRDIADFNTQCPINMGMVGELVCMKYNEETKEVEVYCLVNDEIVDLDLLKKNEDMALKSMKLTFSSAQYKPVMQEIANADAGLTVIYESKKSGKSFSLNFTPQMVKEILENPMTEWDIKALSFENMVAMENASCPNPIEKGMMMIEVYNDVDNVVFVVELDEDIYDVDEVQTIKKEMKQTFAENFNDPVVNRDLRLIKSMGRGLKYKFVGDRSKKSFEIVYPYSELAELL